MAGGGWELIGVGAQVGGRVGRGVVVMDVGQSFRWETTLPDLTLARF